MILLMLTFLIPYLAGWRRGNKWRVLLLTRRQNWFDALLDILEYPNPSLYVLKLEMLVPRIERDISIFEEEQVCTDDKAPNLDLEAIRSEAEEEVDFSCAFTDVNTYHLHVLKKLHNIILNSTDQLKRIKDDVELIEIAGIYAKAFRSRKDEISRYIELVKQNKPLIEIILSITIYSIWIVLLGAILKPMIDQQVNEIILSTGQQFIAGNLEQGPVIGLRWNIPFSLP